MDTLPDTVAQEPPGKLRRPRGPTDCAVVVATTPVKAKVPKTEGSKKLKKKLELFESENQSLNKAISDKNKEITALKRSVDSLNDVLNSVPIDELRCNSSIAGTKILELSKKNRQMRAELEQMKNRVEKKDQMIGKLERELKASEEKIHHHQELLKKCSSAEELQAKMNGIQQKLFESRNKNTELQNQLKLAQKCLQHEIGESCNINILANNLNQANWRGRAQQILNLQQKVQELRARVEYYEERVSDRSEYAPIPVGLELDSSSGFSRTPRTVNGSASASSFNVDALCGSATFDRFTPGVRKNEIRHQAKVEALEKNIIELQSQLEEQRSRTLALKVRNKTLNEEVVKYKMRSSELEEQTDYNGINISTMGEKLDRQRFQYETRLDDMRSDLTRMTEERDNARRQLEELSGMHLELETTLKQKDVALTSLQDMVKKLEMDLRALSGGFLFSCREFRKEEFVGILDALEVEKNQLMLLTKSLNERIAVERTKNEGIQEQNAKLKARISRMEAKIREMEKELDVQSDKKKRTQRMAEYASSLSRSSLNGSIGSFSFDNQSLYQSASTLNSLNISAEPKTEDLKNQLELAQEKIAMLTEKLDYITEEKISDAKLFEETMQNSKTIILETIMSAHEGTISGGDVGAHQNLMAGLSESSTSDSL
ncbi:coiled-coil domain-containing protein 13 [Drosophila pseudoobscura]|uniref:Coiled-coil domain-containing protein 13 n=1 Tax=Drosophila pseudoobscura pseudoobscura TaxID=46245 RepID=A0A6I8UBG4_DROPS|nr:coiled-coil domain-containing protein 13 [Drosophila pseudoobscura]